MGIRLFLIPLGIRLSCPNFRIFCFICSFGSKTLFWLFAFWLFLKICLFGSINSKLFGRKHSIFLKYFYSRPMKIGKIFLCFLFWPIFGSKTNFFLWKFFYFCARNSISFFIFPFIPPFLSIFVQLGLGQSLTLKSLSTTTHHKLFWGF